ncbi:hypothetical protein [Bacillus sp. FJAT-49736]|uniref:hypothetical protein n=1 Tax=Bacillus sp. FJAT-49736 TaxID=2833582 RepID=UPI001BCA4309|nr:hypothetical protein [Bacillus sp. FJAT-49736]MBS4175850.1 hypothetical protein [Bacillus sp. FJAT-49736]
MRPGKGIKRILVSISILIVLFQSFFPYIAAASTVEPWSGNSWSGNSWSGNSWSGNDWEGKTWEGDPWKGNSWEGQSWEGQGTKGNTTQGNGTQGDTTQGNGTNRSGTQGDTTQGNGTNGSGTQGDNTKGNGTNGSGAQGENTQGNGTQGDTTQGAGTDGNGTSSNTTKGKGTQGEESEFSYPGIYDWAKLGIKDVGTDIYKKWAKGEIDPSMFSDWKNTNFKDFRGKLGRQILTGTFKMYTEDIDLYGTVYDGMDAPEAIKNFKDNYGHLKQVSTDSIHFLNQLKRNPASLRGIINPSNYSNIGSAIADGYRNFKGMSALSKANVVTAGVGAVFAGYDTYKSIKDFGGSKDKVSAGADIASNLGSFLMDAGTVAAVIPGGQVVAGAVVAAGAVLWIGGKLVKHRKTIIKAITHPIKTVKDTFSKTWGKLKGVFGH